MDLNLLQQKMSPKRIATVGLGHQRLEVAAWEALCRLVACLCLVDMCLMCDYSLVWVRLLWNELAS